MNPREAWNRLRDRMRRDQLTSELDAELRFHQTMLERDQRARGASAVDARQAGQRHLGSQTHIRERTRDTWSLGWLDDLLSDTRYAARVLRHNVGFSVAVVLTLALGIGANTAIFSVVNAVLLRPLPYADPERLVSVWMVPESTPLERNPTSYPDLLDWQAQNTVFTGIAGYVFNRFELPGGDLARAIVASPTLYTVLGASPVIGRMPRPDEVRLPVVAISHRLWQRRFGANRDAIGQTLLMNGDPYTVIGVMAPGFHFPTPDVDLWTSMYPLTSASGGATTQWLTSRGLRGYRTLARLRPGVTLEAAERQMNEVMKRLGVAYPDVDGGVGVRLQSATEDSVRGVERALWLMLCAAGLVLRLACANVAHLMLARTSTRSREIAIRRALGAHRGRVMRQLLTESVLLGLIGGVSGLVVAYGAMRLLVRLSPGDIPRLENVAIDPTTLAFAALVSVLTGVLFGLAPSVVAWKTGMRGTLRTQGRGTVGHGARARAILTAAEIAFALILLVGAGLMVRSFSKVLTVDLGVNSERVLVFNVILPRARYPNPAANAAGLNRVLGQLAAIPGVSGTGASTSMPPARMQQGGNYAIDGEPAPAPGHEPSAIFVPATPGYLRTLGVSLVAGRHFSAADGLAGAQVVLISRELARRGFAGRDPIGQRLRMDDTLRTIVGVVGDVTYQGLGKPIQPVVYFPWAQNTSGGAWVVVKTSVDPRSVMAAIPAAVHAVDPLMNARELRLMEEMVSDTMVRPRFQTWLLATFGGLGLLLAAVGIYGVIAYGVAQRTAEIGLRLALGATPRSVIALLLGRGMLPVVVGLGVGLATSLALSRLMSGLLFDVSPTDAPTFAAVSVLLGVVAVVAAYVPAARATRLDPLAALRSD